MWIEMLFSRWRVKLHFTQLCYNSTKSSPLKTSRLKSIVLAKSWLIKLDLFNFFKKLSSFILSIKTTEICNGDPVQPGGSYAYVFLMISNASIIPVRRGGSTACTSAPSQLTNEEMMHINLLINLFSHQLQLWLPRFRISLEIIIF